MYRSPNQYCPGAFQMTTRSFRLVLILGLTATGLSGGAGKNTAAPAAPAAPAVQPTVVKLWPADMPELSKMKDKDIPTLTVYLPPKDKATGVSIVICPGGAYAGLAIDHEGHQVAKWLNSIGVAGFILKYRHAGTGYQHPASGINLFSTPRRVLFYRHKCGQSSASDRAAYAWHTRSRDRRHGRPSPPC